MTDAPLFIGFVIGFLAALFAVIVAIAIVSIGSPEKKD